MCGLPGALLACEGADDPPVDLAIETIVIISIDTLRADYLGCYGNEIVSTPYIDALAEQSILFEQHISNSPTTLNSHTSLMTGTYAHTHGVARNGFEVDDRNEMLAEILSEAGYFTAGFAGAFPLSDEFNFDQGFDHYDVPDEFRSGDEVNSSVFSWLDRERPGDGDPIWETAVELAPTLSLAFLNGGIWAPAVVATLFGDFSSVGSLDPTGPLFLFVHYWDVHYPYTPPAPYDRMYRSDDLAISGSMDDLKVVRQGLHAGVGGAASDAVKGLYAGGVSLVDHHVGVLLAGLAARNRFDSAIVLLTSDHGEGMDEHWEFWDHGESLYDTTLHTPLIIHLPGDEQGGTRRSQLVGNVDVLPTLLDHLNLPIPAVVEGISFNPLLGGGVVAQRPPVFSEATKPHGRPFGSGDWDNEFKSKSVREAGWKLVHYPILDRSELFDLSADPGEQHDLLESALPAAVEKAAGMRAQLQAWMDGERIESSDPDLSPEARERLRALGYAE